MQSSASHPGPGSSEAHPAGRMIGKKRKKTHNPREGWENGTPPPHRDFKEMIGIGLRAPRVNSCFLGAVSLDAPCLSCRSRHATGIVSQGLWSKDGLVIGDLAT